jgi:benzoylformate decarboxylase
VTNVRETTHDLLRDLGITTVFGNPGSNELPFLHGFPDDFRYVLGLHESSVMAMADGYAQASGRPAFVNLHSSTGLGNAMGNLANASAVGTPIVVTAGQQARPMIGLGPTLGEADMVKVPEPHVKWSFEPSRAEDVPRALSQAIHLASLPPTGPVFVSLPLDDWDREVDPDEVAHLPHRRVRSAGAAGDGLVAELSGWIQNASAPGLVVGTEVDTEHAYPLVVELAEHLHAPVWIASGSGRGPFPTRHPLFRGPMTASIAGAAKDLSECDRVLVLGSPVFRYHRYAPGPWLDDGTDVVAISSNPTWASRAPFGDAIVADPAAVVAQLVDALPASSGPREPWTPVDREPAPRLESAPFDGEAVMAIVGQSLPHDVRMVQEVTSVMGHLWANIDVRFPRSIFQPGAGGLGFGLPAAVGVSLADTDRPVVAVLGDGSTQYGITGLWTAVQFELPITFIVIRNGEYGALRRFVQQWNVKNTPGLDLPGMDAVQIARGYGMAAHHITHHDQLAEALDSVGSADGPRLIEIAVRGV